MKQLPLGVRLSDRARFESFVAGANGAALAALERLLAPAGAGVLWLWGPAGSGRSHLLQAACARAGDAAYFPLRELRAPGPGTLEGAGLAGCVAVDDVQAVAGQGAWDQALFYLYREVERRGGRLVLAADAPPQGLPFRLADLASRLAAASIHRLHPLDEAGQREALGLRARMRGLDLPPGTADWLLRRYRRDMPSLLALLERLDVASLSAQRRLTVPFIRQVLGEEPPPPGAAPASPHGAPGGGRG